MVDRVVRLEGRGLSGLNGESYADILRETGAFGVLPDDTDEQAIAKINAVAIASAELAEDYAEAAAIAAAAVGVFPTVADGEAATTDGQSFYVTDGTSFALYRNDSDTGVLVITLPTQSDVIARVPYTELASTAPGEGASLVGKTDGGSVEQSLYSTVSDLALSPLSGALGSSWKGGSLKFEQVSSNPHLTTSGGALLQIRPDETNNFIIGDGSTAGTNFTPSSGETYDFHGSNLIHRAANAGNQSHLFTIENVDNVTLRNFEMDGEELVRNGVTVRGLSNNILVENVHFHDGRNFAVQVADVETDPALARVTNMHISNVRIDGKVGPTGAGSGINLFPRSQDGSDPASKGFWLTDIWNDVSQGEPLEANHGPQAYKFNNLDLLFGSNLYSRGGDVQSFVITNGTRRVRIFGLQAEFANRGLQIDTDGNVATTVTQDVEVHGFSYRKGGTTGDRDAIYISGSPKGVRLFGGQADNRITLATDADTDELEGLQIHGYRLTDAKIFVPNPATPTPHIKGATISSVQFDGVFETTSFDNGGANRAISNSYLGPFISTSGSQLLVNNHGSGNHFPHLNMIDGNPNDAAGSCAISDFGNNTTVDYIELSGTHNVDWFFRKRGGSGFHIGKLSGTPTNNSYINITDQESSKLITGPIHKQSAEITLSGAASEETIFVADRPCVILSVGFIYTEASSADAGINLQIKSNATALLTYVSEVSKSLGTVVPYQNTSGVNSFSGRVLAAGRKLVVSSAGGKIGTGKIMAVVYLCPVEQ